MSLNSRIKQNIRSNLVRKRGNRCCFCLKHMKREETTLEHIVPLSKGGKNAVRNLTVSCKSCNNERGDMDFELFKAQKQEQLGISDD